jgi:hypothetical protein
MVANSENTRCPALTSAEGQPRAKQAAVMPLGVCNEHEPPPEGKMCSGLHRNMQRSAEMTDPASREVSNIIEITRTIKRISGIPGIKLLISRQAKCSLRPSTRFVKRLLPSASAAWRNSRTQAKRP